MKLYAAYLSDAASFRPDGRKRARKPKVGSVIRKLTHAGLHRRRPAVVVDDFIRAPLCQLDAVLRLARLVGKLSNDKGIPQGGTALRRRGPVLTDGNSRQKEQAR